MKNQLTGKASISGISSEELFEPRLVRRPKKRDILRSMKEHKELAQINKNQHCLNRLLCLYDGIKLRSYDLVYQEWIKTQVLLFKLDTIIDGETGLPKQWKGRYKNIDIDIHYTPQGMAVDFSGSVHVWSNAGKHNHNNFYWNDFLRVYFEMTEVFKFHNTEVRVVNLEVGVNCALPEWIKFKIAELLERLISINKICKKKSEAIDKDKYIRKLEKGERYYKIYDKSRQFGLPKEIVRLELGYKRARQITRDAGIVHFTDLTKLASLIRFKSLLLEAFEDVHTYQPDLDNISIKEIEADKKNIMNYQTPSFWCNLKKEEELYKKARGNYQRLKTLYCSYDLSNDVRRVLQEKLDLDRMLSKID